jgi:hypothetical protein
MANIVFTEYWLRTKQAFRELEDKIAVENLDVESATSSIRNIEWQLGRLEGELIYGAKNESKNRIC